MITLRGGKASLDLISAIGNRKNLYLQIFELTLILGINPYISARDRCFNKGNGE